MRPQFIYCREYGLQPALLNINYGASEANGNPIIIINQSVKNLQVPGNTVITMDRVLYKKCILLNDFNGIDIYVGKKTNLTFQNVAFDFVNDKWRIRDFHGHPLNNTKFNVYDRPVVKSILSQFLTSRVDEVFNLMYQTIGGVQGKEGFLRILETVMEYKDEFFNLLKPYEVPYVDPYADNTKTNGTGTNLTVQNPVSESGNHTIYYVGGTLFILWLVKRINKKNR